MSICNSTTVGKVSETSQTDKQHEISLTAKSWSEFKLIITDHSITLTLRPTNSTMNNRTPLTL